MTYTNWQEKKADLRLYTGQWVLTQQTPSQLSAQTTKSEINSGTKFGSRFPTKARVTYNDKTNLWEVWAQYNGDPEVTEDKDQFDNEPDLDVYFLHVRKDGKR